MTFETRELQIKPCRTPLEIQEAILEIAALDEVAVDTETTGLRWWLSEFRPFYISFAGPTKAWGFDFPTIGRSHEEDKNFLLLKDKIFSNKKQKHIYANAKYDLHVLKTVNIEDEGEIHDIQIMAKLLDENRSVSLDNLSKEHLPESAQKKKDMVDEWFAAHGQLSPESRRYDQLPREMLEEYAIQDTVATWFLYHGFKGDIEKDFKEIYEIERSTLLELVEVEHWGYKLDVPFLQSLEKEFVAKQSALANHIRQLVLGEKNVDINHRIKQTQMFDTTNTLHFDIGNDEDVSWLLFEVLGIPKAAMTTTKTGKTSLDKFALERLDHPAVVAIAEWRKMQTLLDTFIRKLPELTDEMDVLHGTFIQLGARTGRMSSEDPNMQNIPKDHIRKGFVPRPGYVLVSMDYSQIEMRILAHYCQEPMMINAYKQGFDLHKATAAEIYNKPEGEIKEEERDAAKKINFGIIYGLGAPGLAKQLKWSEIKAKEMLGKFNAKFPQVNSFKRSATDYAEKRGWVKTFWGRRRRFLLGSLVAEKIGFGKGSKVKLKTGEIIDAPKWYTAVNGIVSGTATGDLIKIALTRVGSRHGILKDTDGHVVSIVHDDLQFELPEHNYKELIPKLKAAMEDFPMFRVPIKVDVAFSEKSWGEKEKWK